jgi:hypothetical protein
VVVPGVERAEPAKEVQVLLARVVPHRNAPRAHQVAVDIEQVDERGDTGIDVARVQVAGVVPVERQRVLKGNDVHRTDPSNSVTESSGPR